MPVSRRDALVRIFSLLVASSSGGLLSSRSAIASSAPGPVPRRDLTDALKGVGFGSELRELGRKYLDSAPEEERDAAKLADLLFLQDSDVPRKQEEVALWIGNEIRRDFSEGRSVLVDHWFLSVTEARVCALLHLLQP